MGNSSTLYILFVLLIVCVQFGNTQVLIDASKAAYLEKDRYKDIKESPYYFKDWMEVKIIDENNDIIEGVIANHNCYTGEIEIKKDGREIELDHGGISSVKFDTKDGVVEFVPSPSKKLNATFVVSHYQGNRFDLFELKHATISEVVFQDVGKTRTINRFSKKTNYFLRDDASFDLLKLKKKDFIKAIGGDKDLEKHIKKEKIKMKKIADYVTVLRHWEEMME